jgi:superfamily I DNA/RNA helicase
VAQVADPLEPMNCPETDKGQRQVEGRIFLCLLRLIANPKDHLAWRAILKLRKNGIGDDKLESLYELARKQGNTFYDVLDAIASNPNQLPRFGNVVKGEVEAIRAITAAEDPSNARDLVTFIRDLSTKHIRQPETREAVCKVFERVLEATQVASLDELLRAINASIGDKDVFVNRKQDQLILENKTTWATGRNG